MILSHDKPTPVRWQDKARQVANAVRARVLEHALDRNGAYLSQACSSAEILSTLYVRVMKLGPSQAPLIPRPFPGVPSASNRHYFTGAAYNGPKAPHLDRFFLSPVHYSLVLYSVLVETGRMAPEGLQQFNQDGSTVEMIGAEHSPGLEITAGSLGQALSQAAGIALARRLKGHSGHNWIFMSDGEFQSGQTWEAMQCLGFYGLDNLSIYVDVNRQQCDGRVEEVMRIEPLDSRLEAFGALVVTVDGHDVDALASAAEVIHTNKPLVVLAYTNPCQGLPLLEERRPKLHYVRFKSDEERRRYQEALEQMRKLRGDG